MEEPDLRRLAELYYAWIHKTPPQVAGQYNEILPLHDFTGNPIKTKAMVTWNVLRDRYEMEPVIRDSAGVTQITSLDIPSANYPQFLEIWADAGIITFHRVLVDGKTPAVNTTKLEEIFTLTGPRA